MSQQELLTERLNRTRGMIFRAMADQKSKTMRLWGIDHRDSTLELCKELKVKVIELGGSNGYCAPYGQYMLTIDCQVNHSDLSQPENYSYYFFSSPYFSKTELGIPIRKGLY